MLELFIKTEKKRWKKDNQQSKNLLLFQTLGLFLNLIKQIRGKLMLKFKFLAQTNELLKFNILSQLTK